MNVWITNIDNQIKYHVSYDGLTRRFDNYFDAKDYIDNCLANMSLKETMKRAV